MGVAVVSTEDDDSIAGLVLTRAGVSTPDVSAATTGLAARAGGTDVLTERTTEQLTEADWLGSLWETCLGARLELRHVTDPREHRVDTYLLVRAPGAAELVSRIADRVPPGLTATVITAESDLKRILLPFPLDPNGIVEIGKTISARPGAGGDTDAPRIAAVTPWRGSTPMTWRRLWTELVAQPVPVLVSTGLRPFRVDDDLKSLLAGHTERLRQLSRSGPSPTGSVFGRRRAPDDFAAAAVPLFADAVDRYADRAFDVRVSLAAAGPLSRRLTHQVAEAVSTGDAAAGLAGRPASITWPGAAEVTTAWQNVTGLGFTRLLRVQDPIDAVGPVERGLATTATVAEATAAFRLPAP
ncbi:hypothetical protein V5P93_002951 [Actinokineospora auranticolor]|uniref:Uncharacterized protein n=1 Tax=Actinokineospora auranticolor TaxID=155976 RepID=A0A2S6H0Y5_9PSEU|nr:hypothetical protein [Actinokineospora auranticolor]PPK71091.1 hypothetical protein CLV40_101277 [Actinokineospora auranticolor]